MTAGALVVKLNIILVETCIKRKYKLSRDELISKFSLLFQLILFNKNIFNCLLAFKGKQLIVGSIRWYSMMHHVLGSFNASHHSLTLLLSESPPVVDRSMNALLLLSFFALARLCFLFPSRPTPPPASLALTVILVCICCSRSCLPYASSSSAC